MKIRASWHRPAKQWQGRRNPDRVTELSACLAEPRQHRAGFAIEPDLSVRRVPPQTLE